MAPTDPPEFEDWLQLASTLLTAVLFVVTLLAFRRRRTTRTLLVAIGFALFALRGLFSALADFVVSEEIGDTLEGLGMPLEIAFLALVAIAFLKS